ncbi:MAG: FUSC family membrane protein [Flavisolibacter sp.]
MFNVYGNRASSVGSAALLLMILLMDKPLDPSRALSQAFLITVGGIFYTFISLALYKLRPFRIPQRALGENIREIAKYLSIKADFYNQHRDLEQTYKKLVSQQIIVHERQDNVRELLFKTRHIAKESSPEGRKLVLLFVQTVDLFEVITASYFDYLSLRTLFAKAEILNKISVLIKKMALELDQMGIATQTNSSFSSTLNCQSEIRNLEKEMEDSHLQSHALLLQAVVKNIRELFKGFGDLAHYFQFADTATHSLDHSKFITHQPLDPVLFWNNFSMRSSVFRHALRVSIASLLGYGAGKFISHGQHNYWILMTIIFMLKPAFSLTKQRNIYRISGTLIGGLIGILVLVFIPGKDFQFALLILFMLGTYSFMRINYLVAVIFTTPYILILFKFLGLSFLNVAEERILDTIVGCFIAYGAGYLLFPSWEASQLKIYLLNMIRANRNYLLPFREALQGKPIDILHYKLVRKEVYVSSANLSAAFQRMLSEPKSKQTHEKEIHQLVVLNHILFSSIATVTTAVIEKPMTAYEQDLKGLLEKSLALLKQSLTLLGDPLPGPEFPFENQEGQEKEILEAPPDILKDQLAFIGGISLDIHKVSAKIKL